MAAFEAREYVASSGLMTVHGTARIGGINYISTEGSGEISSMSGPLYNYLIGLVVPAVVMIIFFIVWGCTLLCAKICCKGKCSKNVALTFFVTFCCLSLLGWALALGGNVNTTHGVNAMLNGVSAVQGLSLKVVNLTKDASAFSENMLVLSTNMTTSCSNDEVDFPIEEITNALNGAIDSSVGDDGLVAQAEDFNNQVDDGKDMIVEYVSWREYGTMIVIVVTMVVLTIFMVSTALRVMDSTPEQCRPFVKCSSRSTSCIVFIFGILLLLIIWIFVAIIHVIVTAGSDICAPNVNTNINILANELINEEFSRDDPCLSSDFRDSTAGIICFYQTCEGTNQLEDLTGPIRDQAADAETALRDFKDELNNNEDAINSVADLQVCFDSMDRFLNGSLEIFTLIDKALNLTECPEINPVYAALLYDGFCNGLVDGLVFTYVSCILAAVFMMLAMSIFRIFDFNKYEYGRLPEGYYDDGKGGKVDAYSGGPITQNV